MKKKGRRNPKRGLSSGDWRLLFFLTFITIIYIINPFDIPGPIDDALVALICVGIFALSRFLKTSFLKT